MKRLFSALLAACLLVALLFPGLFLPVRAAQLDGRNLNLSVDGGEPVCVKAYQSSYDNHFLISMRDLASALKGTAKAFSIGLEKDDYGDKWIVIRHGETYTPVGGENQPIPHLGATDNFYAGTAYNKMRMDGREMKLSSYLHTPDKNGPTDIFLRLTDLGLYLDLALEYTGEDSLRLDTGAGYEYDIARQESEGYFHFLHSVVLADAQTGCILFGHDADETTQIASITKLMTYLLVKEALDDGRISEDSEYTVSEKVYRLANSEDGIYRKNSQYGVLQQGGSVRVRDLINAMLVTSANEAALALAEMVSGSEAAFVTAMNQRAEALGLTTAVFYNPHGLPLYTQSVTVSKQQNEMSAADMFRLTQYLLLNHREHLTAVTRQTRVQLPSFAPTADGIPAYARVTNALVYNLDGCLGLKTGTTTRSGANIVTAQPVTDVNGQTHDLVVVLFGAEDDVERCEKAGWLLKYAAQRFSTEPFPTEAAAPETAVTETTAPTEPETLPPEPTAPAEQAPETVTPLPTQTTPMEAPEAPLFNPLSLILMGISCLFGVTGTLAAGLLLRSRKSSDTYTPRYRK